MNIEPSYQTAAIAGSWTVLDLIPFEMWMAHLGSTSTLTANMLWLVAGAVFLFIPGYFLVIGSNEGFQSAWSMDEQERLRYRAINKRKFIWFVSAEAVGVVWSMLLSYLLR